MGHRLKKAVLDTGPVIHLDQIDSLNQIEIFKEVFITETVLEELAEYKIPQSLENIDYRKTAARQNLSPG